MKYSSGIVSLVEGTAPDGYPKSLPSVVNSSVHLLMIDPVGGICVIFRTTPTTCVHSAKQNFVIILKFSL